jgi:hypothetical protein
VQPGRPSARDSRAYAADLRRGNLVLTVADGRQLAAARRLAREVAGADDNAALRAAGQAIRVVALGACGEAGCSSADVRDASGRPVRVAAEAHGRTIAVPSVDDPALRAFLEYWLGRSAE